MARAARRAVATLLIVAGLTGALGVPVASAHVTIVKTTPSKTAKTTLRFVSILFSGPIRSGTMKVVGPHGEKVSNGAGGRDPRSVDRLLVGLKSGLVPGSYTAEARWIAADGHHQEASLSFRLIR